MIMNKEPFTSANGGPMKRQIKNNQFTSDNGEPMERQIKNNPFTSDKRGNMNNKLNQKPFTSDKRGIMKDKMNQKPYTSDKRGIVKDKMNQTQNNKGDTMKTIKTSTIPSFKSLFMITLILMVAAFWVSPAAAQKYVTDPSTGKVVTAPEYGGTITFALTDEPPSPDVVVTGGTAHWIIASILEKLAIAD